MEQQPQDGAAAGGGDRIRFPPHPAVAAFGCAACSSRFEVADYLEGFAADTGADELMTVHYSDSVPNRLRSVGLTAPVSPPPRSR